MSSDGKYAKCPKIGNYVNYIICARKWQIENGIMILNQIKNVKPTAGLTLEAVFSADFFAMPNILCPKFLPQLWISGYFGSVSFSFSHKWWLSGEKKERKKESAAAAAAAASKRKATISHKRISIFWYELLNLLK